MNRKFGGGSSARARTRGSAALALVPSLEPQSEPNVSFCGHCGAKPHTADGVRLDARVCSECGLGLLLQTSARDAPGRGGAFVVLDQALSVCAVSAAAEQLLATSETDAVNRHVTELLVPADAEPDAASNLAAAVTWAATGDDTARNVFVRPANVFGVRISARITSCSPPTAALLVFD